MLVVGLGNPGDQYRTTRHNVGRMVVAALKRKRAGYPAHDLGRTFMNQSGPAVEKRLVGKRPEELIVVHDELDLPFGRIRVTKGGSSAGHNGIKSIIESLGTEGFWRVRVGINRPTQGTAEKYVLAPFTEAEQEGLKQIIDQVVVFLLDSQELGIREATLTVDW